MARATMLALLLLLLVSSSLVTVLGLPSKHVEADYVLSPNWDLHAAPQVRHYDWLLTESYRAPGGKPRRMLVVNGMAPGPLIEANLGDVVEVRVTNEMADVTAIHWHGQPQRGSNEMDGSFGITDCGIAPGTSFTYRWTVQTTGTYWWHAHAAMQYSEGLHGPMILHDRDEGEQRAQYDTDRVLVASDLYDEPLKHYLHTYETREGFNGDMGVEPVPDCGLINGRGLCKGVSPTLAARAVMPLQGRRRHRFRLINAGALASIRFHLEGHRMTVIEADGTLVEPRQVDAVDVMVGQRYSVVVELNQAPGRYKFHADLLDDMFGMENPNLQRDQHILLEYRGGGSHVQELTGKVVQTLNQADLRPLRAIDPPPSTEQDKLNIHFALTVSGRYRAFLNGSSWENAGWNGRSTLADMVDSMRHGKQFQPEEFVIEKPRGGVLDLIINNVDESDHPLHLHGHDAFLLGSGEGMFRHGESMDLSKPFVNPMRRDVFLVPTYGWAVVRVVLDNPGIWALHCHVTWHMAIGFMTQLSVLADDVVARSEIHTDHCSPIRLHLPPPP